MTEARRARLLSPAMLGVASGAVLVPFLLEGVAGLGAMNQSDGIHPNAEGATLVADNVWAVLRPVLEKTSPRRRGEGTPGS